MSHCLARSCACCISSGDKVAIVYCVARVSDSYAGRLEAVARSAVNDL